MKTEMSAASFFTSVESATYINSSNRLYRDFQAPSQTSFFLLKRAVCLRSN